jgi:hypothetical protein
VLIREVIAKARRRSKYWQKHVSQHRPADESEISTWLRQDLTNIIEDYSTADEPVRLDVGG